MKISKERSELLGKKIMICDSKNPPHDGAHHNISLQFEVKLCLRRNTARIKAIVLLSPSFGSNSFTSNWRLKF
jgi:hypothetical protein